MTKERDPYDCVTRGMWNSEDFRALSAPKPNAQTMWFRLLTGPERGVIPGLFAWSEGGFADRMKWPLKDVKRCFKEITDRGMAIYDADAGLLWLPAALDHNPPTSVNQVKAWAKASRFLPNCALKAKAMASLMASLMAKGKPWAEALGMPSPLSDATQRPTHRLSISNSLKQEQEFNSCEQDLDLVARERGSPAARPASLGISSENHMLDPGPSTALRPDALDIRAEIAWLNRLCAEVTTWTGSLFDGDRLEQTAAELVRLAHANAKDRNLDGRELLELVMRKWFTPDRMAIKKPWVVMALQDWPETLEAVDAEERRRQINAAKQGGPHDE